MSAFSSTQVPDSFIISKAFEKGATFATTREATIALGGKVLDTARIHAEVVKDSLRSGLDSGVTSGKTNKSSSAIKSGDAYTSKQETDKSFIEKIQANFTEGTVKPNKDKIVNADILGGIFNTECIPCGDRLNLAGDFNFKKGMQDWFKRWIQILNDHLKKILELLNFLDPEDAYLDFCPLLDFFENFVCVPDIARLISMLMSQMSRISIDFTSVLDLIVGALSPILTPILDALLQIVLKYIAVIIEPIKCILKALESMLTKLDYNQIFNGAPNFDIGVKIGLPNNPNTGKPSGLAQDLAMIAPPTGSSNIVAAERYGVKNIHGNPTQSSLDKKRKSDLKIKKAKEALNKAARKKVDKTDPVAVKKHQEDMAAKRKSIEVAENESLSAVGKAKKQIQNLKSILDRIVTIITDFVRYWENWVKVHLDEFKKWMQGYFGAAGDLTKFMAEKLELLQLIALFKAIMNLKLECKDKDKGKGDLASIIPLRRGKVAIPDGEGNITITTDNQIRKSVSPILEELNSIGTKVPQKINGFVVNPTSDGILNQNVAEIVNKLTDVKSITFECSSRVTSAQNQKVNAWIKELGFV